MQNPEMSFEGCFNYHVSASHHYFIGVILLLSRFSCDIVILIKLYHGNSSDGDGMLKPPETEIHSDIFPFSTACGLKRHSQIHM